MTITNIDELFVHDGDEFVIEAYRNLLKREPDDHGLLYYLGRLAQGCSKIDVIAQLAKSPECRPLDEIAGLKKITLDEQRATSWFWRWFGRRGRMEGAVYTGLMKLAQINTQLARMNNNLDSFQYVLENATNDYSQQLENLVQLFSQVQRISPELDQLQEKPLRLKYETVEKIFMDILGRAPESVEVINHHASSESYQTLCDTLMQSAEFQSRLVDIPEHARIIFMRRIRLQSSQVGN